MLNIRTLIYVVPAILISVTLHELAHGYVSYKMGDPTPKEDGRLSLNPLRHLDLFGTLALLFAGFGWAKPVRVDAGYYKDPKTGMVWTAFAGPLANFILSFICIFLFVLMLKYGHILVTNDLFYSVFGYLSELLNYTAVLSLGQAIFNMIPIPPLDGSKILYGMLPDSVYEWFLRNEYLLSGIIFLLLLTNVINGPLLQLRNVVFNGMTNIALQILF
ncbi:site-2 protease family protein [Merdibacter massiliensis]|uniref:site-2 protease family protein n=1 Tax=Merdibacter massiliensis TaxID=1871030 RepID=UPI00096A8C2D|nr:site-2 protease family protein [Merdibacter massiliensis]